VGQVGHRGRALGRLLRRPSRVDHKSPAARGRSCV